LNSNCTLVECGHFSGQGAWLRRQLERNSDRCVLAYMHHARFSSGVYGSRSQTRGLWKALYRGGADVVLNGHEHIYERFGPQRPSGRLDRRRGVHQFTVGTGGWYLFPIIALAGHSRFAWNGGFGILTMRLRPHSLGWSFLSAPTGASVDHGKLRCHNDLDLPREPRRRRSG
ncbi:MAG: metallophosphoesterase family protein, partial [Solirubrobacterales bacterium]